MQKLNTRISKFKRGPQRELVASFLNAGAHARPQVAIGTHNFWGAWVARLGLDLNELKVIAVFDQNVDANQIIVEANGRFKQHHMILL